MQITVEWNKKTAAVVLFLALGVFFVLTGARALYQQKSATPLSAFGRETGAGGCVTGYVDSYVTITVKNLGNGRRFGVSQTYLAGGREYDFYTVPVSDGQYAPAFFTGCFPVMVPTPRWRVHQKGRGSKSK